MTKKAIVSGSLLGDARVKRIDMGYHFYLAGTAVFSKVEPEKVTYGLPDFDDGSRGRVISLFYPAFVLIACYVPNAGSELKNLDKKMEFDKYMEKYIRSLQKEGKPVIWAG